MTEIASLIATDHIQVDIEIRLGRTRLTVGELARLRPDDVLALDQEISDGVDICIADKVIARGELIDDASTEGRLAVRIVSAGDA